MTLPKTTCRVCGKPVTLQARQDAKGQRWACPTCFDLVTRERVRTWVFSFGRGQTHPSTGERLDNRFLEITGTHENARLEMFSRFKSKWGGQYATRADAGCERFELRPLVGEEALGFMAGTTVAERGCKRCRCLSNPAPLRVVETCPCQCHMIPDEGGQLVTLEGARPIVPCAGCKLPGVVCATPEGLTVRDAARIEDLSLVSIAAEIKAAGYLVLSASGHAQSGSEIRESDYVCGPCERLRDALGGVS